MKYDFIEIGACNFNTLIEKSSNTETGLCIEPVSYYFDQLPKKPFVKKLQLIISPTNQTGFSEIWFVPEEDIIRNNLPKWLAGCNSVGKYHLQHTALHVESLVCKEIVPSIPISTLFEDNDVASVEFLKLDTEGCDCDILEHLSNYLAVKNKTVWPQTIQYESNELTTKHRQQQINQIYQNMGYTVNVGSEDTHLILR